MPIEFTCTNCSKKMRVPDGSEGKKCKCPGCQCTLNVPKLQIETVEIKLEIPCPRCDFILVCSPELEGTRGLCPNCKFIFTIAPPGTSVDAVPLADLHSTFAFQCPHCKQLFEGKSGMEGRKGKCIHCKEVFEIKKYVEPTALANEGNHSQSKQTDAPKRNEPKPTQPPQPAIVTSASKPDKFPPPAPQSTSSSNNNDWLNSIPSPANNVNPYGVSYNPYAGSAPSLSPGSYLSEPVSGDADSIRKRHLSHESAIKGFGLLAAITSGFYLVCSIAAICFLIYVLVMGLSGAVAVFALIYFFVYLVLGAIVALVASGL
jgi:hypothetical protein